MKHPGITASEAARRIGVTRARIDQLARQGALPYDETALGRLFDEDAVDAYAGDRVQA